MSLITDRRFEQGARMTNRTLERETTRGEEVTPDIIWQMTDGVISIYSCTGTSRVIGASTHPPANRPIESGE